MSRYAIQVNDVKKKFSYTSHKNNSLKRAITQVFKPKDKTVDTFYALDGVTFNVEKGDFFGILGRNGSGKSTLLKIISEIYQPTSGTVKHEGKLVSFIELGVGFKAELTGKENVYLNAALLGFSRPEIDEMYEDIVEFAELDKFMDQQLKNYSSGMKVRLAFSVAIRAKSDILILDEVLAVGDAAFQKKCIDYFQTLKDDGKTVILVTHSMSNVRKFCNKAIVIEDGKLVYSGEADAAADKYLALFSPTEKSKTPDLSAGVALKDISIIQNGSNQDTVRFKENFNIGLSFESESKLDDISMGLHIVEKGKGTVIAVSSRSIGGIKLSRGNNYLELEVQNILKDGSYYINLAIEDNSTKKLLLQKHKISPFVIEGLSDTSYSRHGRVYPDVRVVSRG